MEFSTPKLGQQHKTTRPTTSTTGCSTTKDTGDIHFSHTNLAITAKHCLWNH